MIAVRANSARAKEKHAVLGRNGGQSLAYRRRQTLNTGSTPSPRRRLRPQVQQWSARSVKANGGVEGGVPQQLPGNCLAVTGEKRWVSEEAPITASLVKRCIGGDASAWEKIVHVHNRRIYNICYRFTGSPDDAQDLTQEVFIKIFRTLGSYDLERGAFTTWITTVTRNLLVDHFRRSKQDRVTDSIDASLSPSGDTDAASFAEQLKDEKPLPDARLASKETQKVVQEALQKLSPELREAVILRDLQDMDYKEIAAALKVPEGTVKSRINRGRTELARLLSRTYKQVN